MAKNTQPIAKRCKALGISPAVMGYNKKETTRNSNTQNRRKKSEYANQLQEKQKVKFIYGVLEKQFLGYYEKAVRMPGKAGDNLLIQLESRLDNVVFRLGYAATRREARQLKPGMVIELKESSRKIERFKENVEANSSVVIPKWLEFDANNLVGKVVAAPTREDIEFPIEEHLIIELYSK